MTKSEAVNKLLDWCRGEIGYHEGANNYNKYADDPGIAKLYGWVPQNQPWCNTFADDAYIACFGVEAASEMTYQHLGSGSAACEPSASFYRAAGAFYSVPEPGDQIFFYSGGAINHIGIVEDVSDGKVITIEGNTSDMVARRSYNLSNGSIAGYGRPDWSVVSGASSGTQSKPQTVTVPSGNTYSVGSTILRKGMKSIAVRQMQEKLMKLGFDLGRYGADGDFGSATLAAVKEFQKKYGLEIDGEAGPLTLKSLDEAIAKLGQGTVMTADGEKQFCAIGDIVHSSASVYYSKPDGGTQQYCHSGKALVIGLSKNSRYPYQLCKINGGGSNVYGWVAFDTVEKV